MNRQKNLEQSTQEPPGRAPGRQLDLNSLLFGAYVAVTVLAVYSLIKISGSILTVLLPYAAGAVLFVALTAVFLSMLAILKKARGASKKLLAWDSYIAMAVLTVLGYYAAACVQTFQPGGNAAELWTAAVTMTLVWLLVFGFGKFAQLDCDAGKK